MSALIYQQVTDKIITELESGTIPSWVKNWSGDAGADCNVITNKPYSGINTIILGMSGFKSPYWGTYKQWLSIGAKINKDQFNKYQCIVFYSPVKTTKKQQDSDEKQQVYKVMRCFRVYNAEQVTGFEAPAMPAPKVFNNVASIEALTVNSGAQLQFGGDRAYYSPNQDFIAMPHKLQFNSEASYYATLLHELAHWSGHKSRLDRDLSGRFGNEAYAAEELIAELSAAFLCARFNIAGELRHSSYIASWLRVLKNDNKAVFKAAALAQKAADYLAGFAGEVITEVSEELEAA
jgi:antirestriction protein ArdC